MLQFISDGGEMPFSQARVDGTHELSSEVNKGPRNLYARDSKFRPTFKGGMEKCLLRPTFDDLMSPKCTKCTDLHLYFPKISGNNTPQNWGGVKPPPQTSSPQWAPTVPLFQSFCGCWGKHEWDSLLSLHPPAVLWWGKLHCSFVY